MRPDSQLIEPENQCLRIVYNHPEVQTVDLHLLVLNYYCAKKPAVAIAPYRHIGKLNPRTSTRHSQLHPHTALQSKCCPHNFHKRT